jgi:hypothetical protein
VHLIRLLFTHFGGAYPNYNAKKMNFVGVVVLKMQRFKEKVDANVRKVIA